MARFFRRRRYFRRRLGYRRKYRRYRKKYRRLKLANASSRSRTSVKLRSAFDVNLHFNARAKMNLNPLLIAPFVDAYEYGDHHFPEGWPESVYPTNSCLLSDNNIFETYGKLYEEFKLEFMGVKLAITTPINDTSPNPQSVTVTTAWDRKFLATEATQLTVQEQIVRSPSAVRTTALNNSVAKFNRWIRPSDLQEYINWTSCEWSKESQAALDSIPNVPKRFLSSWNRASWVTTTFSPMFAAVFERSNAVEQATDLRVHVECIYVVTFRNPRFGQAYDPNSRQGADSEGRSDPVDRGVLPFGPEGHADVDDGGEAPSDGEDYFSDDGGDGPEGGDDGASAPMKKIQRIATDIAAEAGPGLCRVNDVLEAADAAGVRVPGQSLRSAVSMVCSQINNATDDTAVHHLSNTTEPEIEPWMQENATRSLQRATQITQAVKGALSAYRRVKSFIPGTVKDRRHDPDAPFYSAEAGQPFNLFEHGVAQDLFRDRLAQADRHYLRQGDLHVRPFEGPPRRFVAQWTRSADRQLEAPGLNLDQDYGEYLLALDPGIAREHLALNIAMAWNENRYRGHRNWYGQDALPQAQFMLERLYRVGPRYMYYAGLHNRRTHQEYDVRYNGVYDNGFMLPTNQAMRDIIGMRQHNTTLPSTHYNIFSY